MIHPWQMALPQGAAGIFARGGRRFTKHRRARKRATSDLLPKIDKPLALHGLLCKP